MKMHPLVKQIEEMFLPGLNRLASEMRERYPELSFNVWSTAVGTLTEYQGHDVGIECCFQRSSRDVADNVALTINLCHLTSTPRMMLDVICSEPSCHLDAAYPNNWLSNDDWPVATPEILNDLEKRFPDFIGTFYLAVEHGACN